MAFCIAGFMSVLPTVALPAWCSSDEGPALTRRGRDRCDGAFAYDSSGAFAFMNARHLYQRWWKPSRTALPRTRTPRRVVNQSRLRSVTSPTLPRPDRTTLRRRFARSFRRTATCLSHDASRWDGSLLGNRRNCPVSFREFGLVVTLQKSRFCLFARLQQGCPGDGLRRVPDAPLVTW